MRQLAVAFARAAVTVPVAALAIAYACLKLYDEPVRRWLSRRFLSTATTTS